MTSVLARRPLEPLSMTTAQRPTRRRSAAQAFEDEGLTGCGTGKKSRMDSDIGGQTSTSQLSGLEKPKRRTKKIVYQDADDGFQFSRTRSKKSKTDVPNTSETNPEYTNKQSSSAIVSSKCRPKDATPAPPQHSDDTEAVHTKRRRSTRLSGEREPPKASSESIAVDSRAKRREHRKTLTAFKEADDDVALVTVKKSRKSSRAQLKSGNIETSPRQTTTPRVLTVAKKRSPTKIALPFADTPVIKRNKELRRGGQAARRSSTGTRGRRASSLIDSGTSNAMPHSEVQTEDFYKHIEQSIPEPRRMKHLLVWCGSRALPEKPSGNSKDTSAILAARAIQQELLEDFAQKSELSDWFSREDTAPTAMLKKPNPRNGRMAEMLKGLEEDIQRLQEEERAWKAVTQASASLPLSEHPPVDSKSKLPSEPNISPDALDDPLQASILAALRGSSGAHSPTESHEQQSSEVSMLAPDSSRSALASRVNALAKSLEPMVDVFADGVHQLSQYRGIADRVANRVLGAAADRLEERDSVARERAGMANVGVDDVLGALGSVMADRQRMQR